MDNTNLIFIGGSFVVVVVLFIFALFKFVLSSKPKEREINIDLSSGPSLEGVKMVLDSRNSTLQDLQEAMDKVFEDYDKLEIDKRDIKGMLVALSLHPNAEKNIILDTQKKFTEKNPDLAMEFERAVKKGLDSRGWSKK
ncbi:hypothetical protein DCO58_11375 [Helicobacter saguini]|uniref:Uncharacterized protein n=1 Tax=Helicobacter saguini TaxID=1548018 RepID=A0A347VQ26_9HELI|nr:hypothetical protein [Helicobacter saguini]MWV61108.1 hypothetical protein [Helicobacter saguini]MWV68223.1 hypothetical protein [Helicobacter saguini]MWV70313.1 hypothetical protein [Helicobacter saguini]MWV72215.1 hypothetical protein [Helicobacter saguini]TLD95266.1 hypothetical protein LS64_002605 [Helicobacter saguini]